MHKNFPADVAGHLISLTAASLLALAMSGCGESSSAVCLQKPGSGGRDTLTAGSTVTGEALLRGRQHWWSGIDEWQRTALNARSSAGIDSSAQRCLYIADSGNHTIR